MGIEEIIVNLNRYKRKFYLNMLVRGLIVFSSLIISYFILIATVEFTFQLDTLGRAVLFFSFLLVLIYLGYRWLIDPAIRLLFPKKQISDEEAARQIGIYFPEIADKLLNTIQLQKDSEKNSLVAASISQRTKSLSLVSYPSAINISYNKKYLRYLIIPALTLFAIVLLIPQLITESTGRIIRFQTNFEPSAPFSMLVMNESLKAFRNEDYTLSVLVEGSLYPEQIFLVTKGRKIKLDKKSPNEFSYDFKRLQENVTFYLEGAEYQSPLYELKVFNRPYLKNYNVLLTFPSHVGKKSETLKNAGNLEIPEGTIVSWQFGTLHTNELTVKFLTEEKSVSGEKISDQIYEVKKQLLENDRYEILLENENAQNRENIAYDIFVIKDQYPSITFEPFQDTTLYSYIVLGGTIEDDYGIRNLKLFYSKNKEEEFQSIDIPLAKGQKQQRYFYQWKLDSLALNDGDALDYFLQVSDNDAINGSKSTRTATYNFKIPSRKDIKENLEKESQSAEKQIDKAVEKAAELKEQIKEIDDKIKGKKNLDWQDEKLAEELFKKRQELENEIKQLQEKNKSLFEKQERFNDSSEKIKQKADQLRKLMDELLDEETKKLYDELRKLLEEKSSVDDVRDMIDKIENKEENVEKELERALELFKRMKMDFKLEEIINDLNETIEKQESLMEETKEEEAEAEELKDKQEEINEDFEDIKESLEELENLNEDLKNPEEIEDTEEEQEEISEKLKDAKEKLEQNKKKDAGQDQKDAKDKMQQLGKKMQMMQESMEMTMMEENLDDLRDILDNLIKLSFDQEDLMNGFKEINQSDPRFVTLSQKQLQLGDNAKVIEDSLLSLAGRVFQIASFVTREVDAMNDYMRESMVALKDRNKALAVSKQQFTMTSMNNLALLLSDVMSQMQQSMADAKGVSKGGKKGQKQQMPSLSDLQKSLNDKINDLKKSGKSGRELSEQLAKMAAEQELIRQKLNEMQQLMDNQEGEGGGNLQQLMQKMEETETDLVNKQLTEQMKMRQEEIMTRLLQAENAMRERELDDQREGEAATKTAREIPPAFEEYFKAKEMEIELLRTIPLQLNPFYKKEVNDYFKRLGQD